jgi:hypothetical protein
VTKPAAPARTAPSRPSPPVAAYAAATPAGRRRPPLIIRVFTEPLSAGAIERRFWREFGPTIRRLWWLPVVLGVTGLAYSAWGAWMTRPPLIEPRHRAEAVCFVLAQPPAFEPPMTVEPTAALVRARFTPGTPPAMALQSMMDYRDDMVLRQWRRRVGDFDVACQWLRVPEERGATHWLVLAWMEGADLAVASFRFNQSGVTLAPDEIAWGNRLLQRVLVPENFQAGTLPRVKLRVVEERTLPRFGPKTAS